MHPLTSMQEIDCHGVKATAVEWRAVRASAVDAAARAAFAGYASDRFGPWEVCAQRQALGPWPPGSALVMVTVLHQHDLVQRWLADLPAQGLLS